MPRGDFVARTSRSWAGPRQFGVPRQKPQTAKSSGLRYTSSATVALRVGVLPQLLQPTAPILQAKDIAFLIQPVQRVSIVSLPNASQAVIQ